MNQTTNPCGPVATRAKPQPGMVDSDAHVLTTSDRWQLDRKRKQAAARAALLAGNSGGRIEWSVKEFAVFLGTTVQTLQKPERYMRHGGRKRGGRIVFPDIARQRLIERLQLDETAGGADSKTICLLHGVETCCVCDIRQEMRRAPVGHSA